MRNVERNEDKGRNHYCKSTSSTDQMGYNIMLELVTKPPWPKSKRLVCCPFSVALPMPFCLSSSSLVNLLRYLKINISGVWSFRCKVWNTSCSFVFFPSSSHTRQPSQHIWSWRRGNPCPETAPAKTSPTLPAFPSIYLAYHTHMLSFLLFLLSTHLSWWAFKRHLLTVSDTLINIVLMLKVNLNCIYIEL